MFGLARMISAGFCLPFPLPVNMTLKTNSLYIKWSFFIGYFVKYASSKSDYLQLLLSVLTEKENKCLNKGEYSTWNVQHTVHFIIKSHAISRVHLVCHLYFFMKPALESSAAETQHATNWIAVRRIFNHYAKTLHLVRYNFVTPFRKCKLI